MHVLQMKDAMEKVSSNGPEEQDGLHPPLHESEAWRCLHPAILHCQSHDRLQICTLWTAHPPNMSVGRREVCTLEGTINGAGLPGGSSPCLDWLRFWTLLRRYACMTEIEQNAAMF